jgi:hypothetical protein
VCTTLHAVSHVTSRNDTNVHQVDRRSGSENIVDDHRPWPLARLRTVWYGYPIHQTLNDTLNRANPSLTPHFAPRPKKTDRTLKPHMHFSLSQHMTIRPSSTIRHGPPQPYCYSPKPKNTPPPAASPSTKFLPPTPGTCHFLIRSSAAAVQWYRGMR